MPLSEDEQRILRQIEEQLQRDPGFGRTLHHARHGSRRALFMSGAAAVALLALTVGLLSVHPFLSFAAFAGAVAVTLLAERHARALGEAGMNTLAASVRDRFNQGGPARPGTPG